MFFVLILLVFLLTLVLAMTVSLLLSRGTERREKMMARISALQKVEVQQDDLETEIMKREFQEEVPFLQRLIGAIPGMPKIRLFVEQADIQMEPESFVVITLGVAAVVPLLLITLGRQALISLAIGLAFATVPALIVNFKRQRRFRQFEELFPDAIDQLARAVRAGHAFTTGFDLIGQELPDPVAKEFRITYTEQNLGVPLSAALGNLGKRMPLPDVRFFVAAVQIQRESGGNLGEVLDSLSYVIRERFKLLRQVRVFTAEGRLSMYILTAMPVAGALGLYLMNPEYITPLFTDPTGQNALLIAAGLQVIGYIVIRKMIQIKV